MINTNTAGADAFQRRRPSLLILSFARTTAALLAGEKSVTRREWTDRTFEMWHRRQGDDFQCWSKSPRAGGQKIAIARLKSVTRERTCYIPERDWHAEGFAYMVDHGIRLEKELQCVELWQKWREDQDLVTAVVRFDNVRPEPGFTPETFCPSVREDDPYLSRGREWTDSGDYED